MAKIISEGDPNWHRKARARAKRKEEAEEMAETTTEKKTPAKKNFQVTGKMSGVDAALKILGDREAAVNSAVSKTAKSNDLSIAERKEAAAEADKKKGLRVKDILARAIERGLWSPTGKTPESTLNAAINREIKKKGKESRFKKTGPGMYARA